MTVADFATTAIPRLPRDGNPDEDYLRAFRDVMFTRYQRRNDDFLVLCNAWHGNYYGLYNRFQPMDASGNPILRDWEVRTSAIPTVANIYKGFVDAYKRMLVGLPDIRIPAPPGKFAPTLEGQTQAEAWTEKAKRCGYGIWAASSMDVQQINAAWWLTVCGSFGAVVMPDFDKGHPIIRYVAPWNVYGIGKLNDPIALSRCVVVSEEDPMVVASEFGDDFVGAEYYQNPLQSGERNPTMASTRMRTIKHTMYLDEHYFVRMIGDRVVAKEKHDLGFCPALIPQFIMLPEYRNRGHSVGEQVVPLQHSVNFAVSMWESGAKDSVFKTTVVKDPINVPPNFQRGKGQLITVTGDGDVTEIGGDLTALQTVANWVDFMRNMMQLNTGVSQAVLEGSLSGGTVTGRALEKSMSPYLTGVEEIQTTQAAFMSRLLNYAFQMAGKHEFWECDEDDPVEFSGITKHKAIRETMTHAELADVPAPEIVFAPMAYLGLEQRVNLGLQMINSPLPLVSWQKTVEMLGLTDDIEELRRQVQSDIQWKQQNIAGEVRAQSGGAAPAAGGAGGDPNAVAAAYDAGATNPDTLRRAGVGRPPPVPGAAPVIPAAGAPMSVPATSEGMADAATAGAVSPEMLAQFLAGGPQDTQPNAPVESGLGKSARPIEDTLSQVLSALSLRGDGAFLKGSTLYVDHRDRKKVEQAVPPGITVKPLGKYPPKDAQPISLQAV